MNRLALLIAVALPSFSRTALASKWTATTTGFRVNSNGAIADLATANATGASASRANAEIHYKGDIACTKAHATAAQYD